MTHNNERWRLFRVLAALFFACLSVSLWDPSSSAQVRPLSAAESAATSRNQVIPGIDVLETQQFTPLQSKRVGLITNQTGVDTRGRRTIDVLAHAPGVKLLAIFSPEHGVFGRADSSVANATDSATGLPIFSLYGDTRRPTDAMLGNLDALVYDIQDAGVRFYTFITTMGYCMEAAAAHHIAFYVLDRPDPLGGEAIEGPMLDADRTSFVAYFPMPVRYAMTPGELAQMFNAENHLGADLHIITMQGWHRRDTYDMTGMRWIGPSPNLRSLQAGFLYPGIEILQAGGISVGRGTPTPFELFGAPWIQAADLTSELNERNIPGVRFSATIFTPDDGPYKGVYCQGVSVAIADRSVLNSMRMGVEIAGTLHRMYPAQFQLEKTIELLGSRSTVDGLERGDPPSKIVAAWIPALDRFRTVRAKYLLYK